MLSKNEVFQEGQLYYWRDKIIKVEKVLIYNIVWHYVGEEQHYTTSKHAFIHDCDYYVPKYNKLWADLNA